MPPQDITGAQPSMTVQQGKHTTVLEMEFCVLDFCLVTDSVYRSDYADPESVLVLLTNDLVRRKKGEQSVEQVSRLRLTASRPVFPATRTPMQWTSRWTLPSTKP